MTDLPFPPGSSLAAYVRDSGGTEQEYSTDQQVNVIRAWCETNGYTLTRVYADVAKSGRSLAGRDQLDAMLRHLESGAPEAGVVLWDLSRWARNYDDAQLTLARLRKAGYQVYSLEEKIPPGSVGKIIESLHLWSAERYREQLSQNVKRGQAYVISQHRAFPTPFAPVGYKREPVEIGRHRDGRPHIIHRLVIDPKTAPLVRKAFEMRVAGASLSEIAVATHLHSELYSYQNMLKNKIYTGVLVWGGIEYPGFCESIVDAATWQACQDIHQAWKSKYYHPRRAESPYLLSGLLRCDACGRMMVGTHTTSHRYYRCPIASTRAIAVRLCEARSIPTNGVEQAVIDLLTRRLLTPEYLTGVYSEIREQEATGTSTALVSRLQSQADQERATQRNLISAISATGHSRAMLDALSTSETRLSEIENDLRDAETEQARRPALPENAAELAASVRAALPVADFRDKQLLLRSVIKEIRAKHEGITRIVFYPPGSGEAREIVL